MFADNGKSNEKSMKKIMENSQTSGNWTTYILVRYESKIKAPRGKYIELKENGKVTLQCKGAAQTAWGMRPMWAREA